MFQTIRQTQRATGLPECFIRERVRAGKGLGVYSGPTKTRFLVNVPALLALLERESGVGTNAEQTD